ncbi:metallophosphoesterase family protein [Ruegeria halocynthiae]|uniref:metallophosphoesterase family protein n=1 Tax=Ruegeria halocynthiae TaxID=985054 RepID=UPI00068D2D5B|nr:metallophosphoesterase [Ruegeria halocynthiae]
MSKHLGAKLGCFALISDTHVNPTDDSCNSPFPVNQRANRRFRHVVRELNRQPAEFVIHAGDLLHPVPETRTAYDQAAREYRAIASELTVPLYETPGNHDIGDTPIKGGPASPTTDATITVWEEAFGRQFQAFDVWGIRFLLINAQLINSGLNSEVEQRNWLEAELANTSGKRKMLVLHHPLYLMEPAERDHYDNTNQPGRGWLLDLIKAHGIEAVFAGHAHNFWYDRFGVTDYYLAPATSFVRQDYSEMLRATPPEDSEFGRDDRAKLGYFLVTVYENGHVVRMVRTNGAEITAGDASTPAAPAVIAPDPREPSHPVLGFDLRQNWAEITEVPPSGGLDEFDRKPVRNDYPLLALQEMGVRHLRIPLHDLLDPVRRNRLATLAHLGFEITLFSYGIPEDDVLALIAGQADVLLDWEVTIDWSDLEDLAPRLQQAHQTTGLPILLSRMRTKDDIKGEGTYFHVINHGFSAENTEQLMTLAGMGFAGAVFRLGRSDPVAETLHLIEAAAIQAGVNASVHMRMGGDNPALRVDDPDGSAQRLSEGMTTAAQLKHTRLVCDTLISVDRGYFVRGGMIDRCCNPTPLLDVVKRHHAKLAKAAIK